MKDSRPRKPHIACFYLYEMSRKGWSIYKQISHYLGPEWRQRLTVKDGRVILEWWNVLKQYSHGCAKMINLLEIIELHPFETGWIWRPVNYTSIKLLLKTWYISKFLEYRSSDCMDPGLHRPPGLIWGFLSLPTLAPGNTKLASFLVTSVLLQNRLS